jgi:hypothetical protein
MSRCILDDPDRDLEIVIGWDPGLETFFAQVKDLTLPEGSNHLLWEGTGFRAHQDPDALIDAIEPYAPPFDRAGLRRELLNDQAHDAERIYDAPGTYDPGEDEEWEDEEEAEEGGRDAGVYFLCAGVDLALLGGMSLRRLREARHEWLMPNPRIEWVGYVDWPRLGVLDEGGRVDPEELLACLDSQLGGIEACLLVPDVKVLFKTIRDLLAKGAELGPWSASVCFLWDEEGGEGHEVGVGYFGDRATAELVERALPR